MNKKNPAEKLNPSGKLLINLLFLTAALFSGSQVTSLMILGVLVLFGIFTGGFRKKSLIALIPFTLFALSLIWMNGIWGVRNENDTILQFAGTGFSVPGLKTGLLLALRVIIIIVSGLLLTMTSHPEDLVLSLMQQLRLPPGPAYALLAALNLKTEINRDKKYLTASYRMRSHKRTQKKKTPLYRLLIPLLAINIRRCDKLSLAMEARGFGIRAERTFYRAILWRKRDSLFIVLSVLIILFIFGLSAKWGLPIGYAGWKGYN